MISMNKRDESMHAERLNLQTDAEGNLKGLPKLPANQRIDVVLLFLSLILDTPIWITSIYELAFAVARQRLVLNLALDDWFLDATQGADIAVTPIDAKIAN